MDASKDENTNPKRGGKRPGSGRKKANQNKVIASPKEDQKDLGGRPTRYKPEFAKQALNYCYLGATDDQLAVYFDVTKRTIHYWKKKHPEFADAVKNGKDYADALVAKSLYQRAIGYSCPETKVNVYDGEVILTEITKHYPPDTTACIFFLKNRQPHLWRDKVEVESTGKLDPDLIERLKTDMIERMERARERQKQVLLERGLLDVDGETIND